MRKQSGLTFIEVLVSLVILATGILGAVAMQASAKKGSFDAMQRSIASAYAQDIIERIRSNASDEATLDSYQGTYGNDSLDAPAPRCNSIGSLCTSAQMRANDLYEWERRLMGADVTEGSNLKGGLIDAQGCIEHKDNSITVVIAWQGRVSTKDSADSENNLSKSCGTGGDKRRQIIVNAFVF
ncbi:type IV pilus modification protein PilV [Thalassotalea agariperforans]